MTDSVPASATPSAAQPAATADATPGVQRLRRGIVLEILAAGLRDFRAAPLFSLAIGAVYTLGGWALALLLVRFHLPWLVYPLAAGFALVAPLIATACYAVSRTLEDGGRVTWGGIVRDGREAAGRDLGWMALVTGFSLFIWMDIAAILFFGFLGLHSWSLPELLEQIFTTPTGILFLVIGHAAGAVLALCVFSFSVTSFPMLFDRDVDFVTAMVTSVRVVLTNPFPMVTWCATIAALIGLSLLSGLVALPVVLPVLGYASWHLYRRAISPAA